MEIDVICKHGNRCLFPCTEIDAISVHGNIRCLFPCTKIRSISVHGNRRQSLCTEIPSIPYTEIDIYYCVRKLHLCPYTEIDIYFRARKYMHFAYIYLTSPSRGPWGSTAPFYLDNLAVVDVLENENCPSKHPQQTMLSKPIGASKYLRKPGYLTFRGQPQFLHTCFCQKTRILTKTHVF